MESSEQIPFSRDEDRGRRLDHLAQQVQDIGFSLEQLRERVPGHTYNEIPLPPAIASGSARYWKVVSGTQNPYGVKEVSDTPDTITSQDDLGFPELAPDDQPMTAYHQNNAALSTGQIVEGDVKPNPGAGPAEIVVLRGASRFASGYGASQWP